MTTSEGYVYLELLWGEREIQVHVFVFHLEGGGGFSPSIFEFLFELMYFQISAFALRVLDLAWSSLLYSHS